MTVSFRNSGHAIDDFRSIGDETPAASNVARGLPFTMVRLLRTTHPATPSPFLIVRSSSFGASTPAANRHFKVSLSALYRKSAHADQGTMFVSLVEMSAMVSATPRLVPIACAI